MVPGAVLEGHGEDVHDRVVEGLAGGLRVELLRVVRAGADDVVGVVRGVQDDGLDVRQVLTLGGEALAHGAGQVDRGLGLVLGGVLLGVGVQDAALLLALGRERDGVLVVRAGEQPGDDAVLALPDRGRGAFTAHGTVDGLDGHLAGEGRGEGLPGGDLALAGLAGGGGGVQGLADGLVDGLGVQLEQGADAGGGGRAEVCDVVDLVLVEADAADEVDVDLVGGGQAADEVAAALAGLLGGGEDRRDVVARVGVVGGEEGVVEVELTDGGAVGQGGPLRGVLARQSEDGGAAAVGDRAGLCHDTGGGDRAAEDGGGLDGGVVDDPVDDHLLGLLRHLDGVDGDAGDLVGQVLLVGEVLGGAVGTHGVVDHGSRATPHSGLTVLALALTVVRILCWESQ